MSVENKKYRRQMPEFGASNSSWKCYNITDDPEGSAAAGKAV